MHGGTVLADPGTSAVPFSSVGFFLFLDMFDVWCRFIVTVREVSNHLSAIFRRTCSGCIRFNDCTRSQSPFTGWCTRLLVHFSRLGPCLRIAETFRSLCGGTNSTQSPVSNSIRSACSLLCFLAAPYRFLPPNRIDLSHRHSIEPCHDVPDRHISMR